MRRRCRLVHQDRRWCRHGPRPRATHKQTKLHFGPQSPPIPNTDPHPQTDPVVVHRRPALLFFPARIHSTKSSNWTGQEDSSS